MPKHFLCRYPSMRKEQSYIYSFKMNACGRSLSVCLMTKTDCFNQTQSIDLLQINHVI